MRVKRLKMQSFRGISDLTLKFPTDEPTVFIGINGVGKSSILDCLAILLSNLTERLEGNTSSVRLFSEQDITNGQHQTNSQITITLDSQEVTWSLRKFQSEGGNTKSFPLEDFKAVLAVLKEISTNVPTEIPVDVAADVAKAFRTLGTIPSDNPAVLEAFVLMLQAELFPQLDTTTGSMFRELSAIVKQIRHQLEENLEANLPLAVYYPVNRAVFDTPLEFPQKYSFKQIDACEKALTERRIDFKNFFVWFRNQEDLENEERRDNPEYRNLQLEAARNAISSLIPGFSNLRIRRSPLRMTVTKQGQELIVNQLSDGEKCLLAMVGDLARRLAIANPSLPDPLKGSGVVLIDEIELHLHPKWQREIIPALTRTFPNCQFIVTTHSPQVLSQVKPDSIYILERTEEGIIARRPHSSYGRDSNRILEDLMDTPERPQEIKESILELFRLIDDGKLAEARQLQKQLADEIGIDEPDFASADVLIRRKEILGR